MYVVLLVFWLAYVAWRVSIGNNNISPDDDEVDEDSELECENCIEDYIKKESTAHRKNKYCSVECEAEAIVEENKSTRYRGDFL